MSELEVCRKCSKKLLNKHGLNIHDARVHRTKHPDDLVQACEEDAQLK